MRTARVPDRYSDYLRQWQQADVVGHLMNEAPATAADEEEGALPEEDLLPTPSPSSDLCTLLIENIEYPANADVYYKAAMKNAFDTLSGYAVSIGAEGPQFLKHLFAYYILGQACTNEIRSRLRAEEPVSATAPVILRPRPTPHNQQPSPNHQYIPHIRSKKRRRGLETNDPEDHFNDVTPLENVPSTSLPPVLSAPQLPMTQIPPHLQYSHPTGAGGGGGGSQVQRHRPRQRQTQTQAPTPVLTPALGHVHLQQQPPPQPQYHPQLQVQMPPAQVQTAASTHLPQMPPAHHIAMPNPATAAVNICANTQLRRLGPPPAAEEPLSDLTDDDEDGVVAVQGDRGDDLCTSSSSSSSPSGSVNEGQMADTAGHWGGDLERTLAAKSDSELDDVFGEGGSGRQVDVDLEGDADAEGDPEEDDDEEDEEELRDEDMESEAGAALESAEEEGGHHQRLI